MKLAPSERHAKSSTGEVEGGMEGERGGGGGRHEALPRNKRTSLVLSTAGFQNRQLFTTHMCACSPVRGTAVEQRQPDLRAWRRIATLESTPLFSWCLNEGYHAKGGG